MRWLIDARRWTLLFSGALLLGVMWIVLSRVDNPIAGSSTPPNPQVGFTAPGFTLDSLSGDLITLSDLRGKVVVLNLWASWCPPCRAEMPALNAVYERFRDQGLVVLGVNTTYQDDEAGARAAIRDWGLTFPIVFDRDGATGRQYRVQAMPTTFFIGHDGVIRDIVFGGPMSEALIASKIEKLLSEE
jgi:cytochrome c biogenesis protein CcmG, thiol:disulfide interchange protein DsbE